jgi:hypothetical protein
MYRTINPLSASCSCDARIGGCHQNGLRGTQPTSTNQKTIFTPVDLSLMHFIQNIQIPMNPFCAKTLKLTITWYHMTTMALRRFYESTKHNLTIWQLNVYSLFIFSNNDSNYLKKLYTMFIGNNNESKWLSYSK